MWYKIKVSGRYVKVNIFDEQPSLSFSQSKVKELVCEVITFEREFCDEVNIYFVNKDKISELHGTYFNDDSPTDCISFPMDEKMEGGTRILGEVFVCPEIAVEYAKAHGVDPYTETSLYIVHGLLHLMGYDDIKEQDRGTMREAEARHMENLEKHNLLLK